MYSNTVLYSDSCFSITCATVIVMTVKSLCVKYHFIDICTENCQPFPEKKCHSEN